MMINSTLGLLYGGILGAALLISLIYTTISDNRKYKGVRTTID